MEYLSISFTHKNTDIATREKLAFNNDLEKSSFLTQIKKCQYINEAILLSTCNRVELILSVNNLKESTKFAINQFSTHSTLSKDELLQLADLYENESSVHHIFTVASSLDSLVVGETQIAGQLKDAFRFSLEKEFASIKLSRVLHYAFKCAAKVRNATQLGSGSVSVASVAVSKAKELFKDSLESNNKIKALVIGAGEMSELASRHLLKYGFNVVICSRNIKKARLLAHSIISDGNGQEYDHSQIEVKPYDQLNQLLNSMQLMITATAAPYPIIKEDMVEPFNKERFWFDIALPRDIEQFKYDNLNIYSVDDLQCIVDENIELRTNKAKEAYQIVSNMTSEFFTWLNTLNVEPLIKTIHLNAQKIIEKKVDNAIKKHYINPNDKENIQKLCQTVINEFLHHPVSVLKEQAKNVEDDTLLENTQILFNIEEQ